MLRVLVGGASSAAARGNQTGKTAEQPVAEALGVSVYAQQFVHGRDRQQLERLCRYVMRPPLSQERLALRDDGRLELTLKLARPSRPSCQNLALDAHAGVGS